MTFDQASAKRRRNAAYRAVELAARSGDIGPLHRTIFDLFMSYIPLAEWREGGSPICFVDVTTLARRVGRSERTVFNAVKALEKANMLDRRMNARGQRHPGYLDKDGRRHDARGLDLFAATNALAKYEAQDRAHCEEVKGDRTAWRALLALKARAQSVINRASGAALSPVAMQALRKAMNAVSQRTSSDLVEAVEQIHAQLRCALNAFAAMMPACGSVGRLLNNDSDASESSFRPNTSTTEDIPSEYCSRPVDNNAGSASRRQHHIHDAIAPKGLEYDVSGSDHRKRNRPDAPANSDGLDRVPIEIALQAASPDFLSAYDMQGSSGWPGLVEAAALLRPSIGISEDAWREAYGTVGPKGAALCVLVADARRVRGEIRSSVGGFLRAMVRKAPAGQLNLAPTIFGLAGGTGHGEHAA